MRQNLNTLWSTISLSLLKFAISTTTHIHTHMCMCVCVCACLCVVCIHVHRCVHTATVAFRRLAGLIATKHNQTYSTTLQFIRCKISFSLIDSASMCLRGPHSSFHAPANDINFVINHCTSSAERPSWVTRSPSLSQNLNTINSDQIRSRKHFHNFTT